MDYFVVLKGSRRNYLIYLFVRGKMPLTPSGHHSYRAGNMPLTSSRHHSFRAGNMTLTSSRHHSFRAGNMPLRPSRHHSFHEPSQLFRSSPTQKYKGRKLSARCPITLIIFEEQCTPRYWRESNAFVHPLHLIVTAHCDSRFLVPIDWRAQAF
jgi:hypothetical protein